MRPKLPLKSAILPISCLLCLVCLQHAAGLSNLRIQVNNDNLQSPPYLLEAIERAESAELQSSRAGPSSPSAPATFAPSSLAQTVSSAGVADGSSPSAVPASSVRIAESEARPQEVSILPARSDNASPGREEAESRDESNESSVREEVIEEMLDLEPESVLRLSPSNLIDSVNSHESAKAAGAHAQVDDSPAENRSNEPLLEEVHDSQGMTSGTLDEAIYDAVASAAPADKNQRLKSQLPVTSSHLKRPVIRVGNELSDGSSSSSSSSGISTSTNNESSGESHPSNLNGSGDSLTSGPGAKSRASPSVAQDEHEETSQAGTLEKKTAPLPPDTWEPSQVMAGVTNASHVPATVRRQYGHQTRTRITLGGGYQRNKLPPLSAGSESQEGASSSESIRRRQPSRNEGAPPVRSHEIISSSSLEGSRVIEVPERIVLPSSVFKQQAGTDKPPAQAPAKNNSLAVGAASIVRKRDSRCPSNGVTALEHPGACDKYFLCEDGYSSERTCPNGLMYGTRDIVRDFCVHRWQVVCGDKSMPNPISSPGCRWQNGVFNVQGSPKCTPDFYECTDGVFEVKKCSLSGQVYDDKTKSCQFAEQVGCAQEALAEFRCPPDDQTNTYWPFPRYFLNERALIHCVNDKPEIIRCRDHERVDTENLFCVPIDKSVPSSADETGAASVEITERRTPAAKNQREKGKKVKAVQVEDDHSNE